MDPYSYVAFFFLNATFVSFFYRCLPTLGGLCSRVKN